MLFCEVEARIRNKDDLRRRNKVDPVTMTGINLGPSPNTSGCMIYLYDVERFTTASYNDLYFREDVKPRLDRIVGTFLFDKGAGHLPTLEQQLVDTGGVDPPELQLPLPTDANDAPPPAPTPQHPNVLTDNGPNARNPVRNDGIRDRCTTTGCQFDAGHDGPCSHIIDAAARPRRPDLTHRDATRRRDVANVLAAVEGDTTNVLAAATDHGAFAVAIAGDGDDQIVICYNTSAPDGMSSDDEPPKTTAEALNGPHGDEWQASYRKDLEAKIKNGTFTYVRRPTDRKVIKTKVAHAHKHDDLSDSSIITERGGCSSSSPPPTPRESMMPGAHTHAQR